MHVVAHSMSIISRLGSLRFRPTSTTSLSFSTKPKLYFDPLVLSLSTFPMIFFSQSSMTQLEWKIPSFLAVFEESSEEVFLGTCHLRAESLRHEGLGWGYSGKNRMQLLPPDTHSVLTVFWSLCQSVQSKRISLTAQRQGSLQILLISILALDRTRRW